MPFKPGESGNPATQFKQGYDPNRGSKPKGAIHLSTQIQNMLNDTRFTPDNVGEFVETPMQAIVATAVKKAGEGDARWAKWLSDAGYGIKYELEHSGEIGQGTADPKLAADFAAWSKEHTKD